MASTMLVRDAPTAGTVTVNGRLYARHAAPLQEVGALLEARSIHPGRSAFDHLMALAYTSAFGSLWLVRIRGEVWRRRAEAAMLRAARG